MANWGCRRGGRRGRLEEFQCETKCCPIDTIRKVRAPKPSAEFNFPGHGFRGWWIVSTDKPRRKVEVCGCVILLDVSTRFWGNLSAQQQRKSRRRTIFANRIQIELIPFEFDCSCKVIVCACMSVCDTHLTTYHHQLIVMKNDSIEKSSANLLGCSAFTKNNWVVFYFENNVLNKCNEFQGLTFTVDLLRV